tara:strand:- start:1254 stop:2180 length:927 start_codon:yes stop_codon:yes gene_type:complete
MFSIKSPEKFSYKHIPSLLADTSKAWFADDPWRLSAVIAYYALLSLPALLIIVINIVGSLWGVDIVAGRLTHEIAMVMGREAADTIQTMMIETQDKERNLISTLIGIATLIFGSTGVFYHLQISLNEIWQITPNPKSEIWKIITDRARSFAFILVIGFLLLMSFTVTAGISALQDYLRRILPDIVVYIAYVIDFVISIGITTVLFALIFKYLPDAHIRWKTVWIGAILTASLFAFGKFLLAYYFGEADPGSTYGAAGTIVLILLWVSYSCLILFFGAEFTWVFAKKYGLDIIPNSFSDIDNEERKGDH